MSRVTDVDTKCPDCDDNILATWVGVSIVYEDGEWDKFCDYGCFQRYMVKIWKEEIQSIITFEVEKL